MLISATCSNDQCCCPDNFYGFNCGEECVAVDDCGGHYSCDPDGIRVCHPGWDGLPECRIRLWPPEGCDTCSQEDPRCFLDEGACENATTNDNTLCFLDKCCCLANYYGENCDVYCESRSDCFGHYSCDPEGFRICNPGWTGLPECRIRDWPYEDDVDPMCPEEGCPENRTCFDQECCCPVNLYGENCTVECDPRDDCEGHYMCTEEGERECMFGWDGLPDCLERVLEDGEDDVFCPEDETCLPGYCWNQTCCCPDGKYLRL